MDFPVGCGNGTVMVGLEWGWKQNYRDGDGGGNRDKVITMSTFNIYTHASITFNKL